MTNLRAATRRLSLATMRASRKWAASRTTWTPRPSKRSWLSTGAMVRMVSWTWAMTRAKSTSTGPAVTPRPPPLRAAWAAEAAAIRALEGTQP